MRNALELKGKYNIHHVKFNHIEGGFGEGERSILAYDVADIHQKEVKHINEAINKNINKFKEGVDYIDLKKVDQIDHDFFPKTGISTMSFARSRKVFLLSQRGYLKLVKILEDPRAWEVYNILLDDYFRLKNNDIISPDDINSEFLFQIAKKMQEQEERIKVLEPQALAWQQIVDTGKSVDIQTAAQAFNIKGLGRNNMFQLLRDKGVLQRNNKPYQVQVESGRFVSKVINNKFSNSITLITPKGLEWLAGKLVAWGYLRLDNSQHQQLRME